MRSVLAVLAFLLLSLATVPGAQAAVTTPEELCNPGHYGVCHWYTGHGQCAVTHVGTVWAGACTTGDLEEPVRFCSTVVTPFWNGWCPQDGNVVQGVVGELIG